MSGMAGKVKIELDERRAKMLAHWLAEAGPALVKHADLGATAMAELVDLSREVAEQVERQCGE